MALFSSFSIRQFAILSIGDIIIEWNLKQGPVIFFTKWFIRYFGDSRKKNITTLVPTNEARQLAMGCEVEDSPGTFGVSRIYISEVEKLMDLGNLITRSLGLLQGGELQEGCG